MWISYVDKLLITFLTKNKNLVTYRTISKLDISHYDILYQTGSMQGVKHFYLTDSQYVTCKNVQFTSYTKKDTIILYYYSMFENVCSVYIPGGFTFLEQTFDCKPGTSVLSTNPL